LAARFSDRLGKGIRGAPRDALVADLTPQPGAAYTAFVLRWPPAPPEVDRGVFFVGFPSHGRGVRPYRGGSLVEIDWVGYTALSAASGASCTDITLVFDHEHDSM
jgi:hypothetical protein